HAEHRELQIVGSLVRKVGAATDSADDERRDTSVALLRRKTEHDRVGHAKHRLDSKHVATSGDFDVQVETAQNGAQVVQVSGAPDVPTVPVVEGAISLLPAAAPAVIDLNGCTFLDSAGVRLLARSIRQTTSGGGRVALVAAPPPIVRVLEITALGEVV